MDKNTNVNSPSLEDVQRFEMLYPLLISDLSELRELSKKKQDEALNKFKVKTINKKLIQIKEILKNEPTSEFLELFDDDTFPSNSDAVLMLAQFKSALDQYKQKYHTKDSSDFELLGDKFSWKTKR
jgi:hypothetical protein